MLHGDSRAKSKASPKAAFAAIVPCPASRAPRSLPSLEPLCTRSPSQGRSDCSTRGRVAARALSFRTHAGDSESSRLSPFNVCAPVAYRSRRGRWQVLCFTRPRVDPAPNILGPPSRYARGDLVGLRKLAARDLCPESALGERNVDEY